MADEIYISADEIETVVSSAEEIVTDIFETIITEYQALQNNQFYMEGKAKVEVDALLSAEGEATANGENYFSKLQSLGIYYGLIKEFSMDALKAYQDLDESIANLYKSYCEEMLAEW
ncbi:MAG: hypothetical protein ACK5LC_08790 [Coprobacillaceae bacterium]